MHILVCIKQVPRDNTVKVNSDLTVNADGIEKIINLFDEYALEEALTWSEQLGGTVTALSLSADDWSESLRRALAMGVNDTLMLRDPAFASVDTLGAARAVAAAVRRLHNIDLVIAGRNSTDDESGAFGPMLARLLGWPQLTYVGKVTALNKNQVSVERHLESVTEHVTAPLPAVVTVVKDINHPRYPSLLKIKKASKAEIPTWSAADLGLSAADLAPAGRLVRRVPPPPRPGGQLIEGANAAEKVQALVEKLAADQLI